MEMIKKWILLKKGVNIIVFNLIGVNIYETNEFN